MAEEPLDLKKQAEEALGLSYLDEVKLYLAWSVLQRKAGPMFSRFLGNWQTSLLGVVAAVVNQLQVGIPQDKNGWIQTLLSAVFAGLGLVSKDAKTGSSPGATS